MASVTPAQLFEAFAENCLDKWSLAVGELVVHATFKEGVIKHARTGNSEDILVAIQFDEPHGEKELISSVFSDATRITDMTLPSIDGLDSYRDRAGSKANAQSVKNGRRLQAEYDRRVRQAIAQERLRRKEEEAARIYAEQQRLQARKEKKAREDAEQRRLDEVRIREQKRIRKLPEATSEKEFAELREKYCASGYMSTSPINPLYPILLDLDTNKKVSDEQLTWLIQNRVHGAAAIVYGLRFDQTKDPWDLIRCSSRWRSYGDPDQALIAISRLEQLDLLRGSRIKSAALTTKGGAYRDVRRLVEARSCAKQAVKLSPSSYYAYNLLGGISYDAGYPEQGDRYFEMALDLGATQGDVDRQVRGSFKRMEELDRVSTAQYLLQKDPNRFSWAREYLL